VYIEHVQSEEYHFTVQVGDFAREGTYIIACYDPSEDYTTSNHWLVYGTDKIKLTDLGLYGIEIGSINQITPNCPTDTCTLYNKLDFRLREKQFATAYSGEYVYASFSLLQAQYFDKDFSARYVLLPGGSTTTQADWTPDWFFLNVET
jgi:hypothetical protein